MNRSDNEMYLPPVYPPSLPGRCLPPLSATSTAVLGLCRTRVTSVAAIVDFTSGAAPEAFGSKAATLASLIYPLANNNYYYYLRTGLMADHGIQPLGTTTTTTTTRRTRPCRRASARLALRARVQPPGCGRPIAKVSTSRRKGANFWVMIIITF